MTEGIRSVLVGTAGLGLLAAAALVLTVTRSAGDPRPERRRRLAAAAGFAIAAQVAHFTEEWIQGFDVRFPALLGLPPWPPAFFVSFNLAWIAAWILSVAALKTGNRWALFPLWFLAIASSVNGVAHPLLSIAAEGYFPGLWTSPLVGFAGLLLVRRLTSFTDSSHRNITYASTKPSSS